MAGATSRARAPGIESEMENILSLHAERPTFLHPVWLRTWFDEFGDDREAVFIAVGEDGQTAVAPMMREDNRLTFMGDSNVCDFMDFLVPPSGPDAAYASLWARIVDEDWSELDLWGLRASSPTRDAVTALAAAAGYQVSEEPEAVSPRIDLPGDWEAYLASLGKKDRHELRRKMRRLFESGGDVTLRVLEAQADVIGEMDEFLRLHTVSRHDKAVFMTPEMAGFFRRMASACSAEGLIRLFMLDYNGKPVASVLCFDAGSHLYMYNSGYDPEFSSLSVGLASKALVLRWAIDNGKAGVDFLRGDEPYKYDLGGRDQEIRRLVVRR